MPNNKLKLDNNNIIVSDQSIPSSTATSKSETNSITNADQSIPSDNMTPADSCSGSEDNPDQKLGDSASINLLRNNIDADQSAGQNNDQQPAGNTTGGHVVDTRGPRDANRPPLDPHNGGGSLSVEEDNNSNRVPISGGGGEGQDTTKMVRCRNGDH